ncbi:MmgE/PrpD family protein [Chloroflexota bacterium]
MGKDVASQLAEFAAETTYRDIPPEVVAFAKNLTLKVIAGMLAGTAKPSGRKMARMIKDRMLPEEVGAIGCGFRTSLWEATFLNAFNAHASELEDDRVIEGSSWDITVIPLMFSICEKLRLSGKSFMEALIVGMEIHARTCRFSTDHLGIMFVPGSVGPAMAAGRAMGLTEDQMKASIGLSMCNAPLSFANFGTDAHYFESTLQCLQALMSAEMAKEGMFGNSDLGAFLTSFIGKDRVKPERIVENLGKEWIFCETWIKKYPLCLLQHRYVDALLDLTREHKIKYEDVETIEAHINKGYELCNRPEPKTERDLQFSFQHSLGTAMMEGDLGLNHLETDVIGDPRYDEAHAKVKLISHPEWPEGIDADAMTKIPARIIVKMKDGKELTKERWHFLGSPEEPLTMQQFEDLYFKFTQYVLTKEQIEKTKKAILNIEDYSFASDIMDMLVFKR